MKWRKGKESVGFKAKLPGTGKVLCNKAHEESRPAPGDHLLEGKKKLKLNFKVENRTFR